MTTATDFLREAERLGCEVVTAGERIGLRGPGEAVARLRPDLARLKPDLLRVLKDGTAAGDPWPAGIPRWPVTPGCPCVLCSPEANGYPDRVAVLRAGWPEFFPKGDR